ncbi:MAG: AmmeMemoRadiSam system protein A [Phycisphaerae bacterium]
MATETRIESREQRALLRKARDTARELLGLPRASAEDIPPIPGRFGGVFVTFWAGKRLRGCVGSFASTEDIVSAVCDVTRRSLADPRFAGDPITADELPRLQIEISILSDLEATTDPLSLRPGVHGVMIRCGEKSGCFLPKVAVDHHWSAEEFLANCCTMKAGLPADAWRESDVEVLLFTAHAFSESGFP